MSLCLISANGDIIVTLLPANTRWPWITPAIFRPELVPEELMAQGLTVTTNCSTNDNKFDFLKITLTDFIVFLFFSLFSFFYNILSTILMLLSNWCLLMQL